MRKYLLAAALFTASIAPVSAAAPDFAQEYLFDKSGNLRSWEWITREALLTSKVLNGAVNHNKSKPMTKRECYADTQMCANIMFFGYQRRSKDDTNFWFTMTWQRPSGEIYFRGVCKINNSQDVRTCFNYDTRSMLVSMKTADGQWSDFDQEPEPKTIKELVLDKQGGWRPLDAIIKSVTEASKSQNRGKINAERACFPEDKNCANAVKLEIHDDGQWALFVMIRYENLHGDITHTNFCYYNEVKDKRSCTTYGEEFTGKIEMFADGSWTIVDDGDQPTEKKNERGA